MDTKSITLNTDELVSLLALLDYSIPNLPKQEPEILRKSSLKSARETIANVLNADKES